MCFSKTTTNNSVQNQSGQSSGTSVSQPVNQNVQSAYNDLLSGATNLANQPLQLYQGNLVAGLTPTQNQGISQISNASTAATPWINAAGNYATQSATPLSVTPFNSSTLAPYLSPYTSQVVDATKALQQEQDAEQMQQLNGSITAAGGWNGDRAAVAQSVLGRQQSLADNANLSNILQQGYQSGVNQFNTQNQANLQAGQLNNQNAAGAAYSLGSLGTSLQNAGLSGGAALLNAGGLQQAVNQAQLNVPYQQYQQQLAYPYQSLSFLSSLLPSIAQGTGVGTSYTGNNYTYGTGTGSQTQPFSILARGGRARLSDGGMGSTAGEGDYPGGGLSPSAVTLLEASNLSRAGENPVPSYGLAPVPQITSYVPSASASGSGFSFPGGSTYAPPSGSLAPMSMSNASGQSQGTGLAKGALDTSGNGFMNGLTSGNQSGTGLSGLASGWGAGLGDAIGSWFGPSAASVAAPDIAASVAGDAGLLSGLGDAASSIMSLALLKRGGRARLADGGQDDDQDDIVEGPSTALSDASVPPVARGPQIDRVMTQQESPFSFQNAANYFAPAQDGEPDLTWDDGTPVGQGRPTSLADAQQANDNIWTRMGGQQQIIKPAYRADPTNAIVKGIGAFLGNHSIGRGIVAGMDEWEKDNHPELDHSGQTQMLRYADGTVIDTGVPTEAALNARATRDYRNTYLDMNRQTREDAITQRRDAAAANAQAKADALAQRAQDATDREADRKTQLRIAEMNANQGRYTYQPATQDDPVTGKPVSGYLRLSTRGDEPPQFISGYTPLKGSAATSGLGGREGVFFNRVTQAGNAATAAAKNIMELPITTTRGIFGGRQQGPGLLDAFKEDLANTVTGQDAQSYNTMMAGVSRNLAAIEASGLAPNGSLTHSMDSLVIKEGDTDLTKLRKLAEARQIVETGLEPNLANPRIPDEQKALVRRIIGQMQEAIPFTQHDITQLEMSKNPRTTINDVMKQRGLGQKSSHTVSTKAEFDALPSGTVYTGKDGKQYRKP